MILAWLSRFKHFLFINLSYFHFAVNHNIKCEGENGTRLIDQLHGEYRK